MFNMCKVGPWPLQLCASFVVDVWAVISLYLKKDHGHRFENPKAEELMGVRLPNEVFH